jgi:hypothetical protein
VDAEPLNVLPQRGAPGLATRGAELLVGGYHFEAGRESVRVVSVQGTRALLVGELRVEPALTQGRHAAPALLADGERVLVAYTDGRGHLLVADLSQSEVDQSDRQVQVTELVDIRYSAGLTKTREGYAVIYTDSSGEHARNAQTGGRCCWPSELPE